MTDNRIVTMEKKIGEKTLTVRAVIRQCAHDVQAIVGRKFEYGSLSYVVTGVDLPTEGAR